MKFLFFLLVLAGIGAGVLFWSSGWGEAFGGRIKGQRLERVNGSPNFVEGRAQNPVETNLGSVDLKEDLVEYFRGSESRKPQDPIPLAEPDTEVLAAVRSNGLRLMWLGHSTVYLEVDGTRVLIDPVWSERASPFTILGPKRLHPVPLSLAELPVVDVVVISHDHYDHLDVRVVRELAPKGVTFAVPLGVGAHLEAWDVPADQIVELDWWQGGAVGSLALIATPARHFSGRRFIDSNRTLWASWVLMGPSSRVFYSGDTGWLDDLEKIGDDYGPFDLTIMKCGAYDDRWPDIHLDGEQAVDAHRLLRGRRMLPVHWLTFDLALHSWDEPIIRVFEAAEKHGVEVVTSKVGELVTIDDDAPSEPWWEAF